MGWKNIKEHYKIEHIVSFYPSKGICIGSQYIHDIMIISPEGKVLKRGDGRLNDDIARYQKEIDADPAKLVELATTPDKFDKSLPVYTYEDDKVVERFCEEYGWPNITHDGEIMYDNCFFKTKLEAAKKAFSEAECLVDLAGTRWHDYIIRAEKAKREMYQYGEHLQTLRGVIKQLEDGQ